MTTESADTTGQTRPDAPRSRPGSSVPIVVEHTPVDDSCTLTVEGPFPTGEYVAYLAGDLSRTSWFEDARDLARLRDALSVEIER